MSPFSPPELSEERLFRDLCEHTFAPSQGPPRVGLEVEIFAFRGVKAVGISEVQSALAPLVQAGRLTETTAVNSPPSFSSGDARLTFEPGGQLEIVTSPCLAVAEALEQVVELERMLQSALGPRQVRFANHGMNPWGVALDMPLQTPLPRYKAMQTYFERMGPDGIRMMRNSCALQINLDAGATEDVPRRWLLANLMSPVLIGVFANSPMSEGRVTSWKSERARVISSMDPTRVGAIGGPEAGADPAAEYLRFALNAGVMVIRTPGGYVPGPPGLTFGEWMRGGSAWGYPSFDDWRYHLTTLFPQVRPRGFFELRAIDAPPVRWRAVPVAVATTLLIDEIAREAAIWLLAPYRDRLAELTLRAASQGPGDSVIGPLAQKLLEIATEALPRLPGDWLNASIQADIRSYYDLYTSQGRCPADELLDLHGPGVRGIGPPTWDDGPPSDPDGGSAPKPPAAESPLLSAPSPEIEP